MKWKHSGVVETERILKALANRRRLLIVRFLHTKGSASVGNIAQHIRLSLAATSRHLRMLANVGLVESEQTSTTVNYSLPATRHPVVETTLRTL